MGALAEEGESKYSTTMTEVLAAEVEATMRLRIQGQQWRMRFRDDGPEELATMMWALVEEDASEESGDGNRSVERGRRKNNAHEETSPTAEAEVVWLQA